jgi:hypothetical protein
MTSSLPSLMLDEHGCPANPIWLIGDSNPPDEKGVRYPLDPRHPTRHSIWTPILEVIQDTVYPRRLLASGHGSGTGALYVRNAVRKPIDRLQAEEVTAQVEALRMLAARHQPVLILSFGRFAFHLCQKALEGDQNAVDAPMLNKWGTTSVRMLQQEFAARVADGRTLVPLLHQTVALSFNHAHDTFCDADADNYFAYTGREIGRRLMLRHQNAPVWRLDHPAK